MKTVILSTIFLLLSISTITAQFNNQRGGRRSVAPPPQSQGQLEPEKPDVNLLSIDKANMYQELLGLDVFSKEVLKSYIKDYYAAAVEISFNEDLTLDDKRERAALERKKFENNLKQAFTEEQVQKIMIEEESGQGQKSLEKKKRKKKRKNKKNKKSDDSEKS